MLKLQMYLTPYIVISPLNKGFDPHDFLIEKFNDVDKFQCLNDVDTIYYPNNLKADGAIDLIDLEFYALETKGCTQESIYEDKFMSKNWQQLIGELNNAGIVYNLKYGIIKVYR